MEIGTYEQIVTHLEMELELNGWETPDELQKNFVSQQPENTNVDRHKATCHHCEKQEQYRNQCRLLKKKTEKTEGTQNNPVNKNSGTNNSNPNSNVNSNNNNNNYKPVTEPRQSQKLFTHLVRHVGKQTTLQRIATFQPMQPIDRLPGTKDRKDRIRSQREPNKVTLRKLVKLQLKIYTINATSSFRSCG